STYEALNPARFGKTRKLVLGKHSGRASVRHALRSLGLTADDSRLRLVLDSVRARAVETKRAVDAQDLLRFYLETGEEARPLALAKAT
ncbi:MAG TPA: hypothetical protein VI299_14830, partial [Polyangiales bacterium]